MTSVMARVVAGVALGASLPAANLPERSVRADAEAQAVRPGPCESIRQQVFGRSASEKMKAVERAAADLARCARREEVPPAGKAELLVEAAAAFYLAGNEARSAALLWEGLRWSRRNQAARLEADILSYLGAIESRKGNWKDAERFRREAEAAGVERDPQNEVLSKVDLGWALAAQKKFKPALTALESALAVARSTGNSALIALASSNLGAVYGMAGRLQEAESLLGQALAVQERLAGVERRHIGTTLNALADVASRQGRKEEAERLWARAVTVMEQVLGGDHPDLAIYLKGWSKALQAVGNRSAAREAHERALQPGVAAAQSRLSVPVDAMTWKNERR